MSQGFEYTNSLLVQSDEESMRWRHCWSRREYLWKGVRRGTAQLHIWFVAQLQNTVGYYG